MRPCGEIAAQPLEETHSGIELSKPANLLKGSRVKN
jgi:hypothetical protein